ncbi:MAG: hypothetical protein HYY50_01215 [Candidatus Kerfeldbacteria bacterium]|nr:hypothetical protein [Candidatus Kerfeldbacteria bacterium]
MVEATDKKENTHQRHRRHLHIHIAWTTAALIFFGLGVFLSLRTEELPRVERPAVVRAGESGTAASNELSSSCILTRADYDADGQITETDVQRYLKYRAARSTGADLNADGANGDLRDDACMEAFYSAGKLWPQIVSPSAGAELHGVVPLIAESSIFQTLERLTLRFTTPEGTTYARDYQVSTVLNPENHEAVVIPFDSLAMANGRVTITICPTGGTTTECARPVEYVVKNTAKIHEPSSQATISGQRAKFSATISGIVTYARFEIRATSGGSCGGQSAFSLTTSKVDGSGRPYFYLDTTGCTNGVYLARLSYLPIWQTFYTAAGKSPVAETTFTVANAVTTTNSASDAEEESTADTTNTSNASDGSSTTTDEGTTSTDDSQLIHDDDQPDNSTTTTQASDLTVPDITKPKANTNLYELKAVTGRVSRADRVGLILKYHSGLDSSGCSLSGGDYVIQEQSVPIASDGTFRLPVPKALKPGVYALASAAFDDGRSGPTRSLCFRVLNPLVKLATADQERLSGNGRLDAYAIGPVSAVEFYAAQGDLPPLFVGRASSSVSGNERLWTLAFDTRNYQPGTYQVTAEATALNGVTVTSATIAVTIDNQTENAPRSSLTVSPPTIADEPDVPDEVDATEVERQTVATQPKPAATQPIEHPKRTGTANPEKLKVLTVANVDRAAEEKPVLKLTGVGPPNSIVTIFIYSNPIVVTTRTDASGNWSYSLDRNLVDGQHEVYVTITDQTGKIVEKSNPLSFFVAEARAVSEEEFVRREVPSTRPSDTYLFLYIAGASLMVTLTILVFLLLRLNRKMAAASP